MNDTVLRTYEICYPSGTALVSLDDPGPMPGHKVERIKAEVMYRDDHGICFAKDGRLILVVRDATYVREIVEP